MKYFLLISFIGLFQSGWGQTIISKIDFQGLKKTKVSYLEHILSISPEKPLDTLQLYQDIQRLYNLRIFKSVDYQLAFEPDSSQVSILLTTEEAITTIPVFNFGGVNDNFFIQLGLLNNNFSGNGHRYKLYYLYSDGHSFFFSHRTPFLKPKSPWGFTTFFSRINTTEPARFDAKQDKPVFYNYQNLSANTTITYRTSFYSTLELGGGYLSEHYKKQEDIIPNDSLLLTEINREGTLFKLIHTTDKRNYAWNRIKGWANDFFVECTLTNDDFGNFYKVFNELKFYTHMGQRGNWAFRVRGGLASNSTNPFAPFILDSYKNIRGSGNRVDRGTAEVTLNAEYRHTIGQNNWSALQLVGFTDLGMWRKPGGTFGDFSKTIEIFSGFGGRFYLAKWNHTVFRFDYGIDLANPQKHGIIFGLGQFF